MGTHPARPVQWIKHNRAALPSIIALLVVAGFWVVGVSGGIDYLHSHTSPMATLAGLYVMLAAVAVSIIVATLALNDLVTRYSRQRVRR